MYSIKGEIEKILSVSSSETQVYNNNSEQTMMSVAIPAGALSTKNIIKFKIRGRIDNQSGSNQTFTIALKYGATTLGSQISGQISNSSNPSELYIDGYLKGDGATNAQEGSLVYTIAGRSLIYDVSGSSAEDSNASKNLIVTITLTTAHASFGFDVEMHEVKLLKV